jgi:RimJ/RimL family protein N-acetyltransferase
MQPKLATSGNAAGDRIVLVTPHSCPATTAVNAKSVRLVALSVEAMNALLGGDLAAASAAVGLELTDYLTTEKALWLWRLRVDQIASDPASRHWVARAVIDDSLRAVVGYAGYHGPPDNAGMVEIGYSVDPRYRLQGYARAIVRELLRRAETEPDVTTVRAAISPDNVASLATISGFGFSGVAEQWDDEDGLELIFEVPTRSALRCTFT